MAKNPDQFHHHEVLDRSYLIGSMWSDFIEGHPAVLADEQLKLESARIGALLGGFYQLAARSGH